MIAFAQREHLGQRRAADGAPFIVHPLEVGAVLYSAGAPEHVVAAGILHDTLEKTDATASALRERFGPAVTAIVEAVSEDEGITDYPERKGALRRQVATAGDDALMVFAADKISKVREWRRTVSSAASSPASAAPLPQRLDHYQRCLELLERRLDNPALVKSLRRELRQLADKIGEDQLWARAA